MRYIQVTGVGDSTKMYINTFKIYGVHCQDGYTLISFGHSGGIGCKESPEEVLKLIKGAEEQENIDFKSSS